MFAITHYIIKDNKVIFSYSSYDYKRINSAKVNIFSPTFSKSTFKVL